MDEAIGSLYFDIGVSIGQVNDLLKELEIIRSQAQARLAKNKFKVDIELGKGFSDATKVFGEAGVGAQRLKKDVEPLRASITALKNETSAYRGVVEATDVSNKEATNNFRRLRDNALELSRGLDITGKEYRELLGVAAQASSSLRTLEGQQTRLGTSANTVVGVTASMQRGFGNLQSAIGPLLGAASFGGLVSLTGDFVGEAQRAQSASLLFERAVSRSGVAAGDANALVERLANTYGILPSTVQGATSILLKNGASLEDVDRILQSAGASAAAAGTDISLAFENVAQGAAQGRSEMFEAAGIVSNVSDLYEDFADSIGVSTDALTESQRIQAIGLGLYEESRYEIEDLDAVLTDTVRSQQNFRTELSEFRQELGERFAPALTTGTKALSGLLDSFDTLPTSTQASVLGVGGITTGVTALAVAVGALRPIFASAFLPPAGYVLAGVAAVSTLAIGINNLRQKFIDAQDITDNITDGMERFSTSTVTTKSAVEQLSEVTDKDGLLGVVETLSTTLTGSSKAGFDSFVQGTLSAYLAQGNLQGALTLPRLKAVGFSLHRRLRPMRAHFAMG